MHQTEFAIFGSWGSETKQIHVIQQVIMMQPKRNNAYCLFSMMKFHMKIDERSKSFKLTSFNINRFVGCNHKNRHFV